jgi:primosomal protein N' (replication factor Y)
MRVVRVLPDVSGLDREFLYRVGDSVSGEVSIGHRVRVPLHGRVVAGWVVGVDDSAETGDAVVVDPHGDVAETIAVADLKEIRAWSGVGPTAELVELSLWSAWRWAGRRRVFLAVASPPAMVKSLPGTQRTSNRPEPRSPATTDLLDAGGGVLRLPPSDDVLASIAAALVLGPVLVVTPSVRSAALLAGRLRRTRCSVAVMPDDWASALGGVDVVIGARAAAWAPCPGLAAAVLVDEHDESLQSEASPTWHAREVLVERCRRLGVPLVMISPSPSVEALLAGPLRHPPPDREARGWPRVQIVDRSAPEREWSQSLITSELIEHLRDPLCQVLCVLNTKGRSRLSACRGCQAVARCERCEAAVIVDDHSEMVCLRCGAQRPAVCRECGSSALSILRPGVSRLREELEAAAARPVSALTASTPIETGADAAIHIGTEAVLHRHSRADVVAFMDFDQELLAPRYRAAQQAMALVIRAARIVGPRHRSSGVVLIQTRLAHHEVIRAVEQGDPGLLAEREIERRRTLGLPPFSALAEIAGARTDQYLESIRDLDGLSIVAETDRALVQATSTEVLCNALATAERPVGSRLRIAVDPARV